MENNNADFIAQVRLVLKQPGMTQIVLAKKLGVTRQTIHNWINKGGRPSQLAKREIARLQRKNKRKSK